MWDEGEGEGEVDLPLYKDKCRADCVILGYCAADDRRRRSSINKASHCIPF